MQQHTLRQAFSVTGIGLHSGASATVTISPAPENSGRHFLIGNDRLPAQINNVNATILSTEVAGIRTVEHLLAALWGMGIDNASIAIDGQEVPILDGSALPWVNKIEAVSQSQARLLTRLSVPINVQEEDKFVLAMPSPHLRFTYGIDFPSAAIGMQWFSWSPASASFAETIAPARTFTMESQVNYLRSVGLIQGGSLDNAIVCDQNTWLNPPLRFPEEPCRHKLLDLLGDLSLLGTIPTAHIIAYKASHHLHVQFAKALTANCDKTID